MMSSKTEPSGLLQTGIDGLDEILGGGLSPHRLYLVEGDPGSGKTTLSLQFLFEGVRRGERSMFVTLSETKDELAATARSHGWTLEGLDVLEIIASEETLKPDARYTMYHPSEVELGETTKVVLAEAERIKPQRLVVDSLSEFRLLAENPLRYRRQILSGAARFGDAEAEWLRSGPANPRAALGTGDDPGGADRMGPGG